MVGLPSAFLEQYRILFKKKNANIYTPTKKKAKHKTRRPRDRRRLWSTPRKLLARQVNTQLPCCKNEKCERPRCGEAWAERQQQYMYMQMITQRAGLVTRAGSNYNVLSDKDYDITRMGLNDEDKKGEFE